MFTILSSLPSAFAGLAALLMVASVPARDALAESREGKSSVERTITVTATGRVVAEPDLARITAGVVTEAETAREALSRNGESMRKLIAGLKSMGIDAKDIATSALQVEPRYTNPREGQPPRVNGYRVINQVSLVQRNLSRLGEVLDQLVLLGANQMSGLAFEVSKAETLKDEARKDALANALRRAQLYAAAARAEVGHVLTISEDTPHLVPPHRGVAMGRATMTSAVPVESGTQELEAGVTVTWALR